MINFYGINLVIRYSWYLYSTLLNLYYWATLIKLIVIDRYLNKIATKEDISIHKNLSFV